MDEKNLKNRTRQKRWYHGNLAHAREVNRKRQARWRARHPDKVKYYRDRWARQNPGKYKKIQEKATLKWRIENKARFLAKKAEWRKRNRNRVRQLFLNYMTGKVCADCGEPDAVVLHHDHVRGTKFLEISRMVGTGMPWRRIMDEIKKCELRCCNCHKKVTRNRTQKKDRYSRSRNAVSQRAKQIVLRARLNAYMSDKQCVDCGESDQRVLENDHVRGAKSLAISTMISQCKPWERVEAELMKCEVRCGNCHMRVSRLRSKLGQ